MDSPTILLTLPNMFGDIEILQRLITRYGIVTYVSKSAVVLDFDVRAIRESQS